MADESDTAKQIHNIFIATGWLLKSIKEKDETYQKFFGNREVKDITTTRIAIGKGFASEIHRCTLIFTDSSSPNDSYSVILKIPSLTSMKKAYIKEGGDEAVFVEKLENDTFAKIHNDECQFYSLLAPKLTISVPKVFSTILKKPGIQEGCILMEDLSPRAITNSSVFHNMNLTQVKNLIRMLAKFHKDVLIMDPKEWRGKYTDNVKIPENDLLKEANERFLKECKFRDTLQALVRKYSKFGQNKDYIRYTYTQAYKDLNLAPVIVHGNLHTSNIMWAMDKAGDVQNDLAAIIDWQTFYEGSPMTDLAMILTRGVDGVVRRQAETFAIDFYLDCLRSEFGGDASKVPYTPETLRESYDLIFMSLTFTIMGSAMFMLGANEDQLGGKALKDAYMDFATLKAIHAFEDVDRLLQGKYQNIMKQYGK